MMRLTFLGTGTSQGVPMIACPCEVCASADPRDKRLRTSALVQAGDLNIVIDAGPDFRGQMLAAGVQKLDAILLTHQHKDHTGGIDDVRAYNYFTQAPVDVWATDEVQRALRKDYAYAFDEHPYPGAPEITLHTIDEGLSGGARTHVDSDGSVSNGDFDVKGVRVTPVYGRHMTLPVTGFRIGPLAYLTDFNHIDDCEIEKLRDLEVLVVNALGIREHISHFNLAQAIDLARKVGAGQTYLTHMSHRMGLYADVEPTLPDGIHLAYDNLTIEL